ncbi:MAG TPA: exopolygalacturonase [Leeuwenhoekiella sp.]|mgnify:FL=1|uniref:rhamnogalacturonidase n=1 Tax=Leeuwenhoekiella palythoae TaxID=573501 RepID=UPI000E98D9B8|nr:glycosyl hydrolase family 28 protein [Leeuwenhoekiella palythoae]UBZ09830.1 exopolygalacturonase [Leeuwenhoekiella palythoae]HAX16838.1 exopolygalacturonase [Leeuwenhoekiella sp.]HCQ76530.1 exopolygalacturonase [Leeuwenhoekiella sp.]
MKSILSSLILISIILVSNPAKAQDLFPDGTPIPEWFRDTTPTDISTLGKPYTITDYGVSSDSTLVQTKAIQAVIDTAFENGGGVIIIPKGTFLSGALFFKQGTHLYLEQDGVLKGSDDISDFPVLMTRIEGESVDYFPALVNADGIDGFTISGKGTLDGNGLRYWKAFWLRRAWNPDCTNKDEMRPRLVYISNCKNVQISDIKLKNSPFWTTHYYKSEYIKLLNLHITSPKEPVKAPSTDAVDIDACQNMLIKNCYMAVNDDAVALKGGKGPHADEDPNNGENRNIIIEDNTYGFCHSALTCGSESIHNYNIIFRRSTVDTAHRIFWLKMRPDTPQHYEYITIEDIKGSVRSMVLIKPWTQFFNLKGEKDMITSMANNITMKNIKLDCEMGFNIEASDQYELSKFTFENIKLNTQNAMLDNTESIKQLTLEKVEVK